MGLTDAEVWEERFLLEAKKYARLLLSVTERELELFQERLASRTTSPSPSPSPSPESER